LQIYKSSAGYFINKCSNDSVIRRGSCYLLLNLQANRSGMIGEKQIRSALISVYDKTGLDALARTLDELGVTIYSTGGTQSYLESLGIAVEAVEDLTGYPSILGGRVKTLHPKVFGGILGRRELQEDIAQLETFGIPEIDLVVVDLYPFEATLASGASHDEVIEKIDIGGISLIRAAAKNYQNVVIIPSKAQYSVLSEILHNAGKSSLEQRKSLSSSAFMVSSHYDSQIFAYFDDGAGTAFRASFEPVRTLRYGENPHQKGWYFGDLNAILKQVHGKEISFNNLLDVDAAVRLMEEFKNSAPTFAILKHTNACGLASRNSLPLAFEAALAADPVSAFGGVLIANRDIDPGTANAINELFCEVVIAPGYHPDALSILSSKKNRVLMVRKEIDLPTRTFRSALNGVLVQEQDKSMEISSQWDLATESAASENEQKDLEFALKLAKHTKSNTIVLAKNQQLCASGTGQTSRVDALKQAIEKAKAFNFDLNGAVMASDAFFPFPDCVEIAFNAGIKAVVQPGGSMRDQESTDFCNSKEMAMYLSGVRHFRH